MFRNLRIAVRMTLLIVVGAGCILGAIIAYSFAAARRLLEVELEQKSLFLARATGSHIRGVEKGVEKVAESVAALLDDSEPSVEQQYALLEDMVARNEEVFGAAIAPASYGTAPYVCRVADEPGRLLRSDLSADDYRYDVWDWFTLPRDLGRPVWTEPYFDEGGGNTLMVTYSVPFSRSGTNGFDGVVTSDISLEWLRDLIDRLPVGKSGYAFLISGNGTFVSHPDKSLIMNETVFSVAEERKDPELRAIGQRMVRGESGFVPRDSLFGDRPCWLAFHSDPVTRWTVGLVIPKDELLAVVLGLSRELLGLGAAGFALLLAVALLIARSISRPLKQLEDSTRVLSQGKLDAPLPAIPGDDEVAHLATAFEKMRTDLTRYIEDLRRTTAAKERIESEMHIARSIQMSLVPRTFPPFPDRRDMEIFALLDPAREIGGDFYDFFMMDDRTLCVVIGDVSGKGIPAALFMAVTRTFLRSIWHEEKSPGPTLTRLNDELARDNEPNMFVTLFCVNVDLQTGACTFANGGHNPPFLLRKDGAIEKVPKIKGAVVGGIEGLSFGQSTLQLNPGDTLFLYTDGVTEAMNPDEALTGEDWAIEQIRQAGPRTCEGLIRGMRDALSVYAAGAEQSDDITMLAFRYLGHPPA